MYEPTGADIGEFFLTAVIWLVAMAIASTVAYYVIKAAVLAALREHTVSSTTGVSIVSSVPLRLAAAPGAPEVPAAG